MSPLGSNTSQDYSKTFCFVMPPQDFLLYHLELLLSSLQYAGINVKAVHASVKSRIVSMASASKHLNQENVLGILN
jgi:hypothetical protein